MKRAILLLAALGLAGLPDVQALEKLSLSDGIASVTVADNDASDANSAAGVITFNGALGSDWTVNVTTGISKPVLGSATAPSLELNSVDVSSTSGGSLTIMLTDTDFGPSPLLTGFSSDVGGVVGGGAGSSLTYSTYLDTSNAEFGTSALLSGLGPFGPGAFAGSGNTGSGPLNDPYSLTLKAVVVHTAGGQSAASSFDGTLNSSARIPSVPDAGSSLLLLGTSLTALGAFARLRKR